MSHSQQASASDISRYLSGIAKKVQLSFNKTCNHHNIPKVCVSELLRKEDGSLNKGDFSLFLSPSKYLNIIPHLNEVAEDLKTEYKDIFADCKVLNKYRLELRLNRTYAYSCVLKDVLTRKDCYGVKENGVGKTVLVICESSTSSLTNLRTRMITQHVISMLLVNGFRVYCSEDLLPALDNVPQQENLHIFYCKQCNLENAYRKFQEKLMASKWLVKEDNVSYCNLNIDSSENIVLDARSYLHESGNARDYDKNIGYLYLKKGCYTECYNWSVNVYHMLQKHVSDVEIVLSIVPSNKRLVVQHCGLILEILLGKHPKNMFLAHQQVFSKNQDQSFTADFYIKEKQMEMEQAMLHKYGAGILNDETWTSVIKILADTVVKFNILLTGFAMPLKIDFTSPELGVRDKGGSFVQYNCARLAMIFKHYEKQLEEGKYKPIPELEAVDFSELKLQQEWHLFFNYVIGFSKSVSDFVDCLRRDESVEVYLRTNRVCQMLVDLSHELSIYYNRNRILVEPFPQLLIKMYPRLYLLQGIHQILKNSLAIVNLPTVSKM